MLEKIFSTPTQKMLNFGMDLASVRNEIIADNIANAETPGFKRHEVSFEEKFREVLENKTNHMKLDARNARHMQIGEEDGQNVLQPELRTIYATSARNDGNNVDIDVEMANSSKNSMYFEAMNRGITNEFRLLRLAISGRG